MGEFHTLTLIDAVRIAERMREPDWACVYAVSEIKTAESFGLNRWQTDGAAWSLYNDAGQPVAMGGLSQAVPWNAVAWMVATGDIDYSSWKKLIRHSRKVFRNAAKVIPRIEAHVLHGWSDAEKFAMKLNFSLEGTRYRAGRNGQDIRMYVYQGK